jgi:transcriptional regulator with XRE-family HTH domain
MSSLDRSPSNLLYQETGRLIRIARESKGMTQGRLAVAVGLSRTSLTNIEKGRQKFLLHTIYDLAAALDVEVHDLLPGRKAMRVPLEARLPKNLGRKERAWIERIVVKSTEP